MFIIRIKIQYEYININKNYLLITELARNEAACFFIEILRGAETDPECLDFVSITGSVVENWSYSSECLITFKGNIAPSMTFSGPLPYSINASTTATTVWSDILNIYFISCKHSKLYIAIQNAA